jgi:hypothetical protein
MLNISIKTVETHRMQMMERLDIHDVAGLVRFAIQLAWLPWTIRGCKVMISHRLPKISCERSSLARNARTELSF